MPRTASGETQFIFTGSEYASDLPSNRVAVDDLALRFVPNAEGDPADPMPDDLSYAIYDFNTYGMDTDGRVTISWSEYADTENCFIGIANFDENRWDWLPAPEFTDDGITMVEFDWAGHSRELSAWHHQVLVMSVIAGTEEWLLDEIWLGNNPQIDQVSPRWGMTGVEIQLEASTTGSGVLEYAWDFGGGASPNTSTEESPVVTLGEPGTYSCSLSATSVYGEDVFEFDLVIFGDTAEWSHNWFLEENNTISEVLGADLLVDDEGCIYQLGHQDDMGDYECVFWLVKYNPEGMMLWNRYWATETVGDAEAMSMDSEGNICVLTNLSGDYQDGVYLKHWTGFIRISPDGELIQQNRYNSFDDNLRGEHICAAPDGTLYLLCDRSGNEHFVICRLTPLGMVQWAKAHSTAGHTGSGSSIAVDASGDISVIGVDFDDEDPSNAGDSYLIKLDSSGTELWNTCWGSDHLDFGAYIDFDSEGNIYGSGYSRSSSDTGQQKWLYVVKLTPEGVVTTMNSFTPGDYVQGGKVEFTGNDLWVTYAVPYGARGAIGLDTNLNPVADHQWVATDYPTVSTFQTLDDGMLLSGGAASPAGAYVAGEAPAVTSATLTEKTHTGTWSDFMVVYSLMDGAFGEADDVILDWDNEYVRGLLLAKLDTE